MTLIQLKAFDQGQAAGSGISISLGQGRSGQFVRIGFTSAAQEAYLGGLLDPKKDALRLSIDDDASKHHLLRIEVADADEANAVPVSGGPRGSIALKVAPYCQVAPGKKPARQMAVSHAPKRGEVVVKLPDWARPEPRKFHQGKSIMDT
ncbi:hypothetical protein FGK63_01890 [Ruegeria sediminis]|uniref:Uncharacterized protein n=1 Tax=Ruegeria sediminis TaxID=2583820 RepID=A0ABY2X390_9RHOB|nr:hypothetical protein [Ruegeria sediminis]TMV09846.1 hypothetical protein FGK63_01890 [Ruegeria sediminis]